MNICAWNACMDRFYFWDNVASKPGNAWADKVASYWYKKASGYEPLATETHTRLLSYRNKLHESVKLNASVVE